MNNIKEKLSQVKKFFSSLVFDAEAHSYKSGGRTLCSVSSTIKQYVEYVDFERIAFFVAKKRSKEEGITYTAEMILQEWEDKKNNSCNMGNEAHLFGENFTKDSIPKTGFDKAIKAFWESLPEHIIPFCFELQMFSLEFGLAGTSDIILYNTKTNKFIIADYKTNEDLFRNHKGKTLLAPFDTLLDNPISKYVLQLSYYQILFEQLGKGFEVESRRIIWVKPDGTFIIYETKDYTKELLTELKKQNEW
jgi:hypothetical protein